MIQHRLHKLTHCTRRRHGVACLAVFGMIAACDRGATGAQASAAAPGAVSAVARDSAARYAADSAAAMASVKDASAAHRLSPAADSLAPYLVFAPTDTRAFVAAVRNKQWLLDVGRMDLDVRKDSARLRLFREAASGLSPIPVHTRFHLAWSRGAEDVVVDSFSVYNGRIVLRVLGSAALDSAARRQPPAVALAVRADSARPPAATSCELRMEPDSAARAEQAARTPQQQRAQRAARKAADSAFAVIVAAVRDSIAQELHGERPPYERLQKRMKMNVTQASGCFGLARRALIVSLRAGDNEWVRERAALVAPSGAVTALRIADLRFRAHDLIGAFDADGDGVDDLAVKGFTQRAGGTSVLRVDLVKKRAERLAAGFAWEEF